MLALLLFLLPGPLQAQDLPAPAAGESAEAEPADPAAAWFDRHFLVLMRGLPVRADFEMLIPTPEAEQIPARGRLEIQGPTRYFIQLDATLENPYTGEGALSRQSFTADGAHLWLESHPPAPAPATLERTSLDLIARLKVQRLDAARDTAGLDPLDMFFDMAVVKNSFRFQPGDRRVVEGRPAFAFRGVIKPRSGQRGAVRWLFDSGARTVEVVFDGRTGLLLSYELRGARGVFARTVLHAVEYPERIPGARFRYDPPEDLVLKDRDPDLRAELGLAARG